MNIDFLKTTCPFCNKKLQVSMFKNTCKNCLFKYKVEGYTSSSLYIDFFIDKFIITFVRHSNPYEYKILFSMLSKTNTCTASLSIIVDEENFYIYFEKYKQMALENKLNSYLKKLLILNEF